MVVTVQTCRNPSLRSPKARRTWGYNCGRPILALNKDILGPEAGCSPGKIILVQMTLNKILLSFDNVHRPSWKVAVLSQNQDFGHAAFWLILAKKVRVPVVAKAHFVESAPPGGSPTMVARTPRRPGSKSIPTGHFAAVALRRPSCSQKMIFIKRSCTWSPTVGRLALSSAANKFVGRQ